MPKCSQRTCNNAAAYRYTWPGQDEAGTCEGCRRALQDVANAIGFHLQLIPIVDTADTPFISEPM